MDIIDYDARETAAMQRLSAEHIRAFSPVTFLQIGIPTRVDVERSLLRCMDSLHERDRTLDYHTVMEYSADEAALIETINDTVVDLCIRLFGRPVRPWMGPVVATHLFRAVDALSKVARRPLRVLEIGCGSGYLGALLSLAGHNYLGTDVTQAYYLWQNRLLASLNKDRFVEGAVQDGMDYVANFEVAHMPWWHFAELYRGNLPEFDVIVCDHTLGELPYLTLRYVSYLAARALTKSPIGLLLFDRPGEHAQNTQATIDHTFSTVGLKKILQTSINGWGPDTETRLDLSAINKAIPLYTPSGSNDRLTANRFIPIRAEEAPIQYDFFDFMGYEMPLHGVFGRR